VKSPREIAKRDRVPLPGGLRGRPAAWGATKTGAAAKAAAPG